MPVIVLLLLTCAVSAHAQDAPRSRADEIQRAREEKQKTIKPEESPAEAKLNELLDDEFVRKTLIGGEGLGVRLGGLPTGQGFAVGPRYRDSTLLGGALTFEASAAGSASQAWLADLTLSAPDLLNDRVMFKFYAQHSNSPLVDYHGPGAESVKTDRTSFRREENSADFSLGVKPVRSLTLGVTGGYYQVNTGPGLNDDAFQVDELFSEASTPGLTRQTNFLRGGFVAEFDNRDFPGAPRNGGFYSARFIHYSDRDLKQHSHQRLNLEAQHYIPFFNDRRVIALRVKTEMTYSPGAQSVPFYLQPVLGGSDDLRGFRQFRFYDDNLIVANAEYRWEAFTGLDMALFFDAGKVARRRSQINFHDLEGAAGVGFRFNIQNSTFLRLDLAKSHEGIYFWFKFGAAF